MGKPYAVAAVVTMVIGSLYILYVSDLLPLPVSTFIHSLFA